MQSLVRHLRWSFDNFLNTANTNKRQAKSCSVFVKSIDQKILEFYEVSSYQPGWYGLCVVPQYHYLTSVLELFANRKENYQMPSDIIQSQSRNYMMLRKEKFFLYLHFKTDAYLGPSKISNVELSCKTSTVLKINLFIKS